MSKEILVIYHGPSCPDGFGARWLLKKAYPEAEFVPGIYQVDPPDVKGRHVIFADFCYKRPVMEKLAKDALSLTVLDHHDSAMKDMEGFDAPNAEVFFDMNRSGIRIAWDFIQSNKLLSDEQVDLLTGDRPSFMKGSNLPKNVPWLVGYIEDRDLWNFTQPHSNEITLATRSYELTDESWDRLLFGQIEGGFDSLLLAGTAINNAYNETIKAHVKNAVPVKLGGVEGVAVNASTLFSEIAGDLAKENAFGATWRATKYGIEWSLRSRKDMSGADVSKIAIQYGGGGHPAAAGFRSSWQLLQELGLLPEFNPDSKKPDT